MCHFMKILGINGFKTDVPYATVYFRCITCKGLIGYFAEDPQTKEVPTRSVLPSSGMFHFKLMVSL